MNGMKLLSKQKPLRFASLRHLADLFRVALANHTPTGPGSLATGQSGAAGCFGPYVGQSTRGRLGRRPCSHAFIDFNSPNEQAV